MSPILFTLPRHPQSHLQSHPPGGSDRPPPPPPSPDPVPTTHTHTLTHPTSFLRTLLHPLTPIRSKRARPRSTDTVAPPVRQPEQRPGPELPESASSGAISSASSSASPTEERRGSWESQMLEWDTRRGPASLARRGSSPVPPWEEARAGIQARLELAADRGALPPRTTSEVPPSPPVALAPRSADKRRKLVVVSTAPAASRLSSQVGREGNVVSAEQQELIRKARSLRSSALFALSATDRARMMVDASRLLFEAHNPLGTNCMDLSEQHLSDVLQMIEDALRRKKGDQEVVVRGLGIEGVEGLGRAGYVVEVVDGIDGQEAEVRVRRRLRVA